MNEEPKTELSGGTTYNYDQNKIDTLMETAPSDEIAQLRAAVVELLLSGALVCAAINHNSVNWGEKPSAERLLKALEQGREALSR